MILCLPICVNFVSTNKTKGLTPSCKSLIIRVGVTRFELATTRPPDEYSKPG